MRRILLSLLIAVSTILAAVVAFITRTIGVSFAAIVFAVAAAAAALQLWIEVSEALSPKCR
jgi:hypothetical protein